MRAGDAFVWRVIEIESVAPQPWRNGGGFTRELLRVPDSPEWGCRISVAEIVRNGPFSPYPCIDRHFALIEGNGLALHLPDRRLDCGPGHPPVVFDGAQACHAVPVAGPVRVCNLMFERQRAGGQMLRSQAGMPLDLRIAGGQLLAILAFDRVALSGDEGVIDSLGAGHLHWAEVPDGRQERALRLSGSALVMQVQWAGRD